RRDAAARDPPRRREEARAEQRHARASLERPRRGAPARARDGRGAARRRVLAQGRVDEDQRQRPDRLRAGARAPRRHLRRRLLQRHARRGGPGLSRGPAVGGVETGGTRTRCVIGTGPADDRPDTSVPTTTPTVAPARPPDFITTNAERAAA